MPFIPDEPPADSQQPKTGMLDAFKRIGGEVVGRALSLPSQVFGGAIKATGEAIKGQYSAPKTGVSIPLTKVGGKKDVDVGELVPPTFIGAFRGARDKSSVMEELPKAVGLEPTSTPGRILGFAGEIATPDIADVALATKAGKGLVGAFGKGLSKTGEYIAEAGVKPTKGQRKAFKDAAGTTIGKFIADKKLAGDLSENLSQAIETLQGDFDDIAIRSGLKASPGDIRRGIREAAAKLDPIVDKQEIEALNDFKALLVKNKKGFDISELTRMRRRLDEKIPPKQWEKLIGGEAVNKMVQQRMALQGIIQEIAGDMTSTSGKTLKQLGQELKPLYQLHKIVPLQEGVTVAGRLGGLGDIASITGGFAAGGSMGAVLLPILRRILTAPRVQGEMSKAAITTGEALQKPGFIQEFGKAGIKTGKEALITPFKQQSEEVTDRTSGFIPD